MATFDVTQPEDTSKIRNGPSLIRKNFQAIVEGDTSFTQDYVNLAETSDPTSQAGQVRLYGKLDGSSETQVWYKNEDATAVKITESGNLGSINTYTSSKGISFDNTVYFDGNNFVIARASVSTDGSLSSYSGISGIAKNGTGRYVLSVTADLLSPTSSYNVLATAFSGSSAVIACISSKPPPSAGVTTDIEVTLRNTSGNRVDNAFQFIVVGGR